MSLWRNALFNRYTQSLLADVGLRHQVIDDGAKGFIKPFGFQLRPDAVSQCFKAGNLPVSSRTGLAQSLIIAGRGRCMGRAVRKRYRR